jgi:hypothetical protein
MARLDTLRVEDQGNQERRAYDKARLGLQAEIERAVADRFRGQGDAESLRVRLNLIETALGGKVMIDGDRTYFRGDQYTEHELADVAKLLKLHLDLTEAARSLIGRYATYELRNLRSMLDNLDEAYNKAAASLPTLAEGVA